MLVVITRAERGGAQVHVRDLVLGLRERFDFSVVVGEEAFLVEELRAASVPVRVLPELVRELDPRRDRQALRALRACIREERPALVHTHSSKAGILGRLAARAEGVASLHTAHSWAFSDGVGAKRKAMAIPMEAAIAPLTSAFIVVSEADREIARRYHVARESQLHIVHNGVPDDPNRARPGAEGVPRIVMVARMAAPKDHVLLLEALSEIELPWVLELIGDGPDRSSLEALCATLGLQDRVVWAGRRGDVPERLAAAQLFALISRQEGFPLSILEAMRAGLPVLASRVGGIDESVQDGVTGRLVERGDREGLRQALLRLLADPGERARLGRAGRQAYEARFTLEHCLQGTARVYEQLGAA